MSQKLEPIQDDGLFSPHVIHFHDSWLIFHLTSTFHHHSDSSLILFNIHFDCKLVESIELFAVTVVKTDSIEALDTSANRGLPLHQHHSGAVDRAPEHPFIVLVCIPRQRICQACR